MSYFATLIGITTVAHITRFFIFGTEGITDANFDFGSISILNFIIEVFDLIVDFIQIIFFFQTAIPISLTILLNLIVNIPWFIYVIGIIRGSGGPG